MPRYFIFDIHNILTYQPNFTSKLCHTLSINHHTSLGYAMRSNTYCSSTLDEFYSTKMHAWRRCDLMQQKHNNCTVINDRDCDDDNYKICKEGSPIKQSSKKGSCTYFKQGNINSKYFLTILRFYLIYICVSIYYSSSLILLR